MKCEEVTDEAGDGGDHETVQAVTETMKVFIPLCLQIFVFTIINRAIIQGLGH